MVAGLMEEMQRPMLTPVRRTAIVRSMEVVQKEDSEALAHATELTRTFADEALAMLEAAKESGEKAYRAEKVSKTDSAILAMIGS